MSTTPIHPLRRWLFEHQMTLAEFRTKSGICTSMLSDIINRKKMPSAEVMAKIRRATHGAVTPNDLVPVMGREKAP